MFAVNGLIAKPSFKFDSFEMMRMLSKMPDADLSPCLVDVD